MRTILRAFFGLLLIAAILLVVEVAYFAYILHQKPTPEKADLIAVFAGAPERIKPAYDLANSGYAPYLVISSAKEAKVTEYARKHTKPLTVTHLLEDKARTTFENAVYTKEIIEENSFNSVILVTSTYHLPRSYFLLRVLLMGSNVRVQPYGVLKDPEEENISVFSLMVQRPVFNEMTQFWASIGELLIFEIKGQLPDQSPKEWVLVKHLRSLFLGGVKVGQENR